MSQRGQTLLTHFLIVRGGFQACLSTEKLVIWIVGGGLQAGLSTEKLVI